VKLRVRLPVKARFRRGAPELLARAGPQMVVVLMEPARRVENPVAAQG
jgi:hypothetical protein